MKAVTISFSSKATLQASTLSKYIAVLSLSSRARLFPTYIQQAVDCECPPWQIEPAPPCGWIIDVVNCSNTVTVYDLPFTIPVFRLHVLGTDPVTESYYHQQGTTTCTISNDQTLVNNTQKEQTLVNAFSRKGCE
jgi:hypothetical protein